MNAYFGPCLALWKREIVRFLRQPSRVVGAFLTPVLFWVMIGAGFGSSFQTGASGDGGYLKYFFPGAILMSVLFTAIFSTMSVIEDRHEGFLQGVLVAPISQSVLILSKVLGGSTLGVLQGSLMLFLAPMVGFSLNPLSFVLIMAMLFLLSGSLTALGFLLAWKIDSVQGYHAVMNVLLLPLWMLSGAVFPAAGSHWLFSWVLKLNPLSYGLSGVRDLLEGQSWPSSYFIGLAVLVPFFVVCFGVSSWVLNLSRRT